MENKNLTIGIIVLVLAVLVGAFVFAGRGDDNDSNKMQVNNASSQQNAMDSATEPGNGEQMAVEEGSDSAGAAGGTMMAGTAGAYVDYSPEALASAQADQKDGRKVVLFFHAPWCPYCVAADKDFKAALSADTFPQNVTLLKTDYDSQTELKRKYGVTTQHTFVQIDSSGNQITKWISGESAELGTKVK